MPQTNIQINTAAAGDTTLVAGVAAQRVRVRGYTLIAAGAVTARLYDGASPTTPLTGPITLAAGVPYVVPFGGDSDGPGGVWHTTTVANNLVLNLSAAVQVSGFLVADQW